MKAIVYYEFGSSDVLRLEDIDKPVAGENQVLVKVRAAALNPADRHLMKGMSSLARMLFKVPKPSIAAPGRPGRDVAGEVEAVGRSVTQFKPGDEVFGCALGAFAEYVCGSESKLVTKPANVTFEDAASAPVAAFTALQGLRDKGHIRAGQKVLVNGASGGVGTYAVQIAKSYGAEVTAVCSTKNLDLVRSIGADHVIDYTKEDFTKGGARYDLVFDCVWTKSLSASRRILNPGAVYVIVGGPVTGMVRFFSRLAQAVVLSKFAREKIVVFMAKSNQEDLAVIRDLMESGKVKAVIDRRYPLCDVPDAVRYLDEGHARGKIIIAIDDGNAG
jgi:NADPH:quinone reductase-like Zn-dependent oxidoreductase